MPQPVVTMKQLLEAGVHFGHQTRRWNPKMKRFIFGDRNGIYIIDLQETLRRIEVAYSFLRDMVADGGTVLFVGTKKQAQDPIQSYAEKCGMPYINERWLGGMLTNFETISKRVAKMAEYQRMRDSGEFEAMPKKEALLIGRELEKLERNLGGIRTMEKLPDAVFILDTKKEHIAVTEANKLGLPIVAVVDTNCDPDVIQYVIPGNDDAIRSGTLMCRIVSDAVDEGRFISSRRGGGSAGPARSAEDEDRVASEQAEARRQAALQAQQREARLAGAGRTGRSEPTAGAPTPPPAIPPPPTGAALDPTAAPAGAAPPAADPDAVVGASSAHASAEEAPTAAAAQTAAAFPAAAEEAPTGAAPLPAEQTPADVEPPVSAEPVAAEQTPADVEPPVAAEPVAAEQTPADVEPPVAAEPVAAEQTPAAVEPPAPAPDPDLTPTPAVVRDAGEVVPAVPASPTDGGSGELALDPSEEQQP